MDYFKLANLLFPNTKNSTEIYENKYPKRNLKEGAMVTRIAPSPTGFIHLGNLYSAVINEHLAKSSEGIFFLRIDDTDNTREIPRAVEIIDKTLKYFGIFFDEGATFTKDGGDYGPYRQRQRVSIYHSFAKSLVEKGYAYPCFCDQEYLDQMRKKQRNKKVSIGYYGDWAAHRNLTLKEIKDRISKNEKYVLRYRSNGIEKKTINIYDAIRGKIALQENNQDIIILKSNGVPTYHFAHVIDDHLMRTTHVIRGEEWLASVPIHLQLFEAFGWEPPVYCHTAQLMKLDGNSKRKLSKRKDPEASLEYYISEGYLPSAVREYLMVLLNSNFEEWRRNNKNKTLDEFTISINKMSKSGALYDIKKLNDISKNLISNLSIEDIYEELKVWARKYDKNFWRLLSKDAQFSLAAISICKEGNRRDFICWSQTKKYLSFFYNELFEIVDIYPPNVPVKDSIIFLKRFINEFKLSDDKVTWFDKIKKNAFELGYAADITEFGESPELYKGHIGNLITVLRITITGRIHSPDLWDICKIIGQDNIYNRVLLQIQALQKDITV